jgi:hypothetical protein
MQQLSFPACLIFAEGEVGAEAPSTQLEDFY